MKTIHLKNETSGPVGWQVTSRRNENVSLDPTELLVDQLFSLLDDKLTDKQAQIISVLGSKVIPQSQVGQEDVSNWFTELGGQSSSSTVTVLNLRTGAYASWLSGNDQSWILRDDRIYPAVMGTLSQVDGSQSSVAWSTQGLSSEAQAQIKTIVDKYNGAS